MLRHKRLRVVFTTEIHGYNLELLYSHCRTVAPSLLVVEASNGTVVGGFCSDAWQVRLSQRSGLLLTAVVARKLHPCVLFIS